MRLPSPRTCLLIGALPVLLVLPPTVARGQEAAPEPPAPDLPQVTGWIAVGSTGRGGRRPFRPNPVFARYLLDPAAAPPQAGEVVATAGGANVTWAAAELDDKGRLLLLADSVGGTDQQEVRIAWAYGTVQSEVDRVVIAELRGAALLFVNGSGHVGDVYGYGMKGVPVALRQGTNHVFLAGTRGSPRLLLRAPSGPLVAADWDATLPDLVAEEGPGGSGALGSVLVLNASTEPVARPRVVASGGHVEEPAPGAIGPLCVAKLPLRVLVTDAEGPLVPGTFELAWSVRAEGLATPVAGPPLQITVRAGDEAVRRTFISSIDRSVQVYAERPPVGETDRPVGLVLSVHGAGVRCLGQARSYSAKPDFWLVAATNRRPFGFDWHDWGRADAYEALGDALERSGVMRSRVYLTGHSMGGHGAWHLAANDPDGFAAVAPSAGWISFDTYAGGRPHGPLSRLWWGADGASRTLDLLPNLRQVPAFIVHGIDDDNVPVQEGYAMERALRAAGAEPRTHYAEGKGHWWNGDAAEGADCVDWPGIFDLFRERVIPEHPGAVEFVTVDPGVDADHHWLHVHQPLVYGTPVHMRAHVAVEERALHVLTSNAGAFRVDVPPWADVDTYVVDGMAFEGALSPGRAWFVRRAGLWRLSPSGPGPSRKGPGRCGPFKRAFDRGFVMVYGTGGDDAEDRELLARARHDALQWWYRGNGVTEVVTDAWFTAHPEEYAGRNVILYGNAVSNGAWDVVLAADCPVRAEPGVFTLGRDRHEGDDIGAVFVRPRRGDDRALVGVFASTGLRGARLGYTLLPFTSGVGYPDYAVFDAAVLEEGDGGVLAAGWFDAAWRVRGGFRRRR